MPLDVCPSQYLCLSMSVPHIVCASQCLPPHSICACAFQSLPLTVSVPLNLCLSMFVSLSVCSCVSVCPLKGLFLSVSPQCLSLLVICFHLSVSPTQCFPLLVCVLSVSLPPCKWSVCFSICPTQCLFLSVSVFIFCPF